METSTNDNLSSRPWLFQPGNKFGKGRVKGSISLKEYAKRMIAEMSEEEKKEFMRGLPKEVIWKMAEGNPKTSLDGGEDENGEAKAILVKFIDK